MQKKLIICGISLFIIQASYAMEPESDACDSSMPICGFPQEQFSLHEVVERDDIGTLNTLLRDPHVDVNGADDFGSYPLHIAVRRKNIPMVQALLDHNASVDVKDDHGRLPLHIAIQGGVQQLINMMLATNKDVDIQDADGKTSLLLALTRRSISQATVFSLLDRSPDVNIVNKDGTSPLHYAIRRSLPDIVKRLLKLNANPNAQDADGNAALHLALNAENVNHEIFDALFRGPSACRPIVNIENHAHDRALHIAVRRGMQDEARKLLAEGADPNLQDAAGDTALHLALVNHNFDFEFIERLMKRFAHINIVGHNRSLPLHLAVMNRRLEEVALLLRYGTDCGSLELSITSSTQDTVFSFKDTYGNTPLHLALTREDVSIELVQLLLNHIASLPTQEKLAALSAKDAAGNTPLHLALTRENVSIELIQLLLTHIATLPTNKDFNTIDVQDVNGNTPLHLAALITGRNKDLALAIINVLLHNGAATCISNRKGQVACDLVHENCPDIKYLIKGFWGRRFMELFAALKAVKSCAAYCSRILTSPIARLFGSGDQVQNEGSTPLNPPAEEQKSGGWCTVM